MTIISNTFLVLLSVVSVFSYDNVLVNTADGPVQGDVLTLHTGDKINTFLGIPFAEPPVGPLRWQAPELPTKWTEPFIANELGNACPQAEVGVIWLTNPLWFKYSENCLNVNVFAPNNTDGAPYPVMFWIYGGGNQAGANIQYPGHFLASKGVVVVVPNYRLNIMGYLTTADAAAPGNYGNLDQVHALKWVQRNIAAFGGDPNNVMISGESAGATNTGLHLLSSMSRGMFHSAMMASGNEYADWAVIPPEDHPERSAAYLGQAFGCPTDNNWAMMDCLRLIDERDLRETYLNCSYGTECSGMGPVVDNVFLSDTPRNIWETGNVARVPEIIGINREESSLAVPFVIPGSMMNGVDRPTYEQFIRDWVSLAVDLPDPRRQEDVTQSFTWYYSPWPHLDDVEANRYQIGMILTDNGFGWSADYQMKKHVRLPATTYQYIFAYVSDNATIVPDWMGCPHMLDLPNLWGYPMLELNPDVRNQSCIVDVIGYTDVDVQYSDYWMTLVTNFVKTGNPTPTPVPTPNGDPDTTWLP